jgi:hypothetical protein
MNGFKTGFSFEIPNLDEPIAGHPLAKTVPIRAEGNSKYDGLICLERCGAVSDYPKSTKLDGTIFSPVADRDGTDGHYASYKCLVWSLPGIAFGLAAKSQTLPYPSSSPLITLFSSRLNAD